MVTVPATRLNRWIEPLKMKVADEPTLTSRRISARRNAACTCASREESVVRSLKSPGRVSALLIPSATDRSSVAAWRKWPLNIVSNLIVYYYCDRIILSVTVSFIISKYIFSVKFVKFVSNLFIILPSVNYSINSVQFYYAKIDCITWIQ